MKFILCVAIIGIAAGTIWYIWASSKPTVLRNEANGAIHPFRFKGYKGSLKTAINPGATYGRVRIEDTGNGVAKRDAS